MKTRRLVTLALALIAAAVLPLTPVVAQITAPPQQYAFQLQVRGEDPVYESITTGRCRILTAGTFNTDATVYSDANLATAATTLAVANYNPTIAFDSTGTCKWFAPTGTNSFDVIVYVDSGPYAGVRARVDGVTRTGLKTVHVDRSSAVRYLSIPFTKNTGTQTSTTKLPAGAVVQSAEVEVTAAVASGTVSFGAASPFAGTAFCNAQSAAVAGFFNCGVSGGVDVGTTSIALTYITSNHNVTGLLNIAYTQHGGN